jgi:hypothetical protein
LLFASARRLREIGFRRTCLRCSLVSPHALPSRAKPGKSRQIVANENPLRESDVAGVDANHQHVQDRPPVRATRIGAPLGGQMNSVRHDVVGSELCYREAAGDVDIIIVTTQSEIMIKEEILNQTVRVD